MSADSNRFRFVDLFAGLGGFHVALSELGGEGVFAAEWDTGLNELYAHNFGISPWEDLGDIDNPLEQVPDHEVLTAGFPCQPFSKAGEQLGFEHTKQGQLFFKVLEILKAKRPSRFILENVPNILRHGQGRTLDRIESELRALGYSVQVKRFSPHQFGVPQIRDRAYFVGSLSGLEGFKWPAPTIVETDVRTVLEPRAKSRRPVPSHTLRAIEVWDDFLKSSPEEVKLPSFPIWAMEFGATYPYSEETPAALQAELGAAGLFKYRGSFGQSLRAMSMQEQREAIPSHGRRLEFKFPNWKIGFIKQNREFYRANRAWIDPWMRRSCLEDLPSSLQKFEWNAQGGIRAIEHYILQARASGLRVKRTTTAPSLIAMTDTQVPIVGWERRYMTPEECAKLQSLDSISLPARDSHAYRALGNAVNAHVVREIARPLVSDLGSKVLQ